MAKRKASGTLPRMFHRPEKLPKPTGPGASVPHHIFVFTLKNGKKRMVRGDDPADARRRMEKVCDPGQMSQVTKDPPERIREGQVAKCSRELG